MVKMIQRHHALQGFDHGHGGEDGEGSGGVRVERRRTEGEGDKEAERVEVEAKWRWRWLVGLLLLLLEPKAKATKPTGPKSQEPAPPPSLLKALAYSTFDTLFRIYLSNIFPLLSLTIQI